MNIDNFIKVVEEYNGIISIPNRATTTYMTCFVRDLAKAAEHKETVILLDKLANELEEMDSSEIARKTDLWR